MSHECVCISKHVLHLLYPAAHNPSPLKRDLCVCVQRGWWLEREREQEGMKGNRRREARREKQREGDKKEKAMSVRKNRGRVRFLGGEGGCGRGDC